MSNFSHLDEEGRAHMVDVSGKPVTLRRAKAQATLCVSEKLYNLIKGNRLEKGEALNTARIAGIQAAKRTSELIPLCHPLPISAVQVDISLIEPDRIQIITEAKAQSNTGVEMEALTAAAVAALTLYDMGKAVDRGMTIVDILLLEKEGGKSGSWRRKS